MSHKILRFRRRPWYLWPDSIQAKCRVHLQYNKFYSAYWNHQPKSTFYCGSLTFTSSRWSMLMAYIWVTIDAMQWDMTWIEIGKGNRSQNNLKLFTLKTKSRKSWPNSRFNWSWIYMGTAISIKFLFIFRINSFFYGNPFGPNPFVFPYVASKTSPFIAF